MEIGVIGAGYVGLIQAVGLAELGFNVRVYDIDRTKIEKLKKGIVPIYEKGLDELLKKNLNRLTFTDKVEDLKGSQVFFVCVGTPQDEKGKANLNFVFSAVESIKPLLSGKELVVLKSTVPVGTNRRVQKLIGNKGYVVSNPEFLREGIAIEDFFNPERVVLGFGENAPEWVKEKMFSVYGYFKKKGIPFVITNWESAELIKYASNTFLAMKISFINELSRLAEKTGADIKDIATGVGLDSRIGNKFLNAGIGWGGSCFHPEEVFYLKTERGIEVKEFKELERLSRTPQYLLSWEEDKGFSVKGIKLATRRTYKGNLIKIKLPLGREITVTEDHPLVVYKDGTLKVKLAAEIKEKDKIPLPLKGLEYQRCLRLDLTEEFTRLGLSFQIKNLALVNDKFETLKGTLKKYYKYPYDVKKTGVITSEVIANKEFYKPYADKGFIFTSQNGKDAIPQTVELNKELARLLGYYAAEGCISSEKTAKGYIRYKTGFTFGRNEEEYINDLKGILEKFNIQYTEQIRENTFTVWVNSKSFAVLLKEILSTGTNSYNKQVPPQIFVSPKEVQEEFLKGLFRGDGSITLLNGGKHLSVELATASKKLAYGVLLLLQNLGILASIRKKRFNKSKVDTYLIRINGYGQLKRVISWFGKKGEKYLKVLNAYKKKIKNHGVEFSENFALFEVKGIEKIPYDGLVYSLETSNGLLIAGGGLVVHNCFPKDVSALIWQFKEHELEPKLPKATKEINEEQLIWFLNKIKRRFAGNLSGKTFALLGLAFKPNTDDLRESPALKLAELLTEEGAFVKGFDYVKGARENVRKLIEVKASTRYTYGLSVYEDLYEAVENVDGIIIAVEYNEWNKEDWNRISELVKQKNIFDGRNILDKNLIKELKQKGWHYEGVGVKV